MHQPMLPQSKSLIHLLAKYTLEPDFYNILRFSLYYEKAGFSAFKLLRVGTTGLSGANS